MVFNFLAVRWHTEHNSTFDKGKVKYQIEKRAVEKAIKNNNRRKERDEKCVFLLFRMREMLCEKTNFFVPRRRCAV